MKYLITGLGNIGSEYLGTRHNIGFRVVNALVEDAGVPFTEERYGAIARMRIKNCELIILKPNTFMNLSGNAVRYWLQKENIPVENLLVIVDDLALPFGTLRLKPKGSDAGHNGLKNIQQLLGTQEYSRLRFGIGSNFPRGGQINYVLGKFPPEELQEMPEKIKRAVEIIKSFCLAGVQNTMNQYNNKSIIVPCLQFMNEVRIDKWMWATRIFKTRTIAAEACKKNRVMINGVNVKPSRMIKVGEVIQVRKPPITFSFKVLDLTERRMGAKLVPDYLENVTTPDQYEILEMNRISGFVDRARGLGRPTKKDRRELEQFTDLGMMNDGFDFEFDFEEPEDEE